MYGGNISHMKPTVKKEAGADEKTKLKWFMLILAAF